MYKGKPETVHETVERVMRENGYLSNPQTLQTDIGNFTWYNESQPQNCYSRAISDNNAETGAILHYLHTT